MYPQGRMSHHFREMKVGDDLAVKGPKVSLLFYQLEIFSLTSWLLFDVSYPSSADATWSSFNLCITF